ncbi:unnamed protein product [Adineta ricciae]|uniref:Uncharacterized protein n=1 Tax=Adineta ricciae TaxID=249248 RepID=A0A815L4B8_ADIRI|nr:unnamed protein product [Adineta ricciae]
MPRNNKSKPCPKPTPENSISQATPPLQKTTSTQTDSPEDLRFVCFTSLLLMVVSSIFVYHLWTIPPIDTWAVNTNPMGFMYSAAEVLPGPRLIIPTTGCVKI